MNLFFKERSSNYSPFLTYVSVSDARLVSLRVEAKRMNPGMSDFVLRVAAPAVGDKDGTVLSIRGNRSFAKYDTCKTLVKTIAAEFKARGDTTFDWDSIDVEHVANMFFPPLKFFAASNTTMILAFTTEAL